MVSVSPFRLYPDGASMRVNNSSAERQTDAGPGIFARVQTLEYAENTLAGADRGRIRSARRSIESANADC